MTAQSMCCERCDKEMYRVNEPSKESPMGGIETEDKAVPPIDLRVGNYRWLFCSKLCMQLFLAKQPEQELRSGGYPLW